MVYSIFDVFIGCSMWCVVCSVIQGVVYGMCIVCLQYMACFTCGGTHLCLSLLHVCSFVMRTLFWKKQADSPLTTHQLSPPSTCDKPLQSLTTWRPLSPCLGTYTCICTMYTIQYIPHATHHEHMMHIIHHTLIHNAHHTHTTPDTRCIYHKHTR